MPAVSFYLILVYNNRKAQALLPALQECCGEVVDMLLLKANPELKKTFESLIRTVNLPVTWTDLFMISNNHLILAGEVRSLIFDFNNKKISTSIIEIPPQSESLDRMPTDALLDNVMNITLYTFGKWGLISGLKVNQDYPALNTLFGNVLRPVKIEPDFSTENFRFYKNDIQVTYEDMMLAVLRLLKSEGRLKEGQSLSASEMGTEEDTAPTAASDTELPEEDDYEIGLWHSMRWKKESFTIQKTSDSEPSGVRTRIGNDFYLTNYLCPDCGKQLYMGVYPTDKELLIETEEGGVYMARTYACHNCNLFFTPRPQKLFQEGDLYALRFDNDRTAYEDYLAILGKKAQKTKNYKFNEFASERDKQMQDETAINVSGSKNEKTARSFFQKIWRRGKDTDTIAEAAQNTTPDAAHSASANVSPSHTDSLHDTAARASSAAQADSSHAGSSHTDSLHGTTARASSTVHAVSSHIDSSHADSLHGTTARASSTAYAESSHTDSLHNATARTSSAAYAEPSHMGSSHIDAGRNPASTPEAAPLPEPASAPLTQAARQNMARLAGKTTEELKSILNNLERESDAAQPQTADSREREQYAEAVKNALRSKLSAKYDARMGTLRNLAPRQLSDLKKQIEKEAILSKEQRQEYLDKIDEHLYYADKKALEQKVELSRKKSYIEIRKMINDIETQDIPQALKQDALDKLKQIKTARAEQEVAHIITHLPLHLDRKQLAAYISKIEQYEGVNLAPYRAQLEQKKNLAEKEEISAMIKRGGKKDRNALWNLYNQLQEQDYKKENKAPFLEKIYERIRQMDEAKIDEICPSITGLSFAAGLQAYEEISQGMFLPELKTNTLEMIQRRLTRLKTDESVQLMHKLKEEMEEKMEDLSHFRFYDAREELKRAQGELESAIAEEDEMHNEEAQRSSMLCAINGYASARGEYEYPLLVYDNSRSGNGKEGFTLTPDHIFYHTFLHTGRIGIEDITQIHTGKKFFEKGIYVQCSGHGKEKLPQKLKKKDQTAFADIIDEFVSYLHDRPESRSIAYMAKEKHDIIRCYRCGFAYKGGAICPRCGSAQNS